MGMKVLAADGISPKGIELLLAADIHLVVVGHFRSVIHNAVVKIPGQVWDSHFIVY